MELFYNIELKVKITAKEAALFYKYLDMHQETKCFIKEGQFAFSFRNVNDAEDLEMKFSTKTIDICLKALEDQNIEDDDQNDVNKLIENLYKWGHIIFCEFELIDQLKLKHGFETGIDFIPVNWPF